VTSQTHDKLTKLGDACIARHVQFDFDSSPNKTPGGAPPVKQFKIRGANVSGREAEARTGAPDMAGRHVIYVLACRHGNEHPIASVLDQDGNPCQAIMLFTHREAAALYLQVARSDEYEVITLSPQETAGLVRTVQSLGVQCIVVDPNRRHQEDGQPAGPVVSIPALHYDPSGENLYQELFAQTGQKNPS
jgi:hypothetical protein